MATFTATPDNGASADLKPNVRAIKFGDGYEQRQGNGLNTMAKVWPLTFSLRSDVEKDYIKDFLEARAGVESFTWVDIDGDTGKYVCRSWNIRKDRFNLNTITAKFEQVFEA